MLPSRIPKKPRNELLAGIVLNHMVENLLSNPIFEGMCIGYPEKGIEPVDRGIEIIRGQGSVIENTKYSFGMSYTVESRGSPFGMIYTRAIVRGQKERGKIRINYREYEIPQPLRERAA